MCVMLSVNGVNIFRACMRFSHFQTCINKILTHIANSFQIYLTTDLVNVTKHFQRLGSDLGLDLLTFEDQVFHVDGDFGAPANIDHAFQKLLLYHLMIQEWTLKE